MLSIKKSETYEELELFDNDIKIGETEIDINNDMLSRFVIYVPYQNMGYGTRILKMLIEKYNISNLWVRSDNKRAIHVYEKCGFEIGEPTMYSMVRRS